MLLTLSDWCCGGLAQAVTFIFTLEGAPSKLRLGRGFFTGGWSVLAPRAGTSGTTWEGDPQFPIWNQPRSPVTLFLNPAYQLRYNISVDVIYKII